MELAEKAYRKQIETLKEIQKEQVKVGDAADKAAKAAIDADRKRVEEFAKAQRIGEQTPQETAANDLLAVTRQIGEEQKAMAKAIDNFDTEAQSASIQRLAYLDQLQAAAQEKVEFGFTTTDANQAIEKIRSDLEESIEGVLEFGPAGAEAAQAFAAKLADLENQLELKLIDPQQFEEAAKQARETFNDEAAQAKRLFESQEKYRERLAELDQERIDQLGRVSQEPLKIEDIRTSGGFSEFVRLANGREDPAIEQGRQQIAELKKMRDDIQKLGGTVEMI